MHVVSVWSLKTRPPPSDMEGDWDDGGRRGDAFGVILRERWKSRGDPRANMKRQAVDYPSPRKLSDSEADRRMVKNTWKSEEGARRAKRVDVG